jgi:hypothetical protein
MATWNRRIVALLTFACASSAGQAADSSWALRLEAGKSQYSRESFNSYGGGTGFQQLTLDGGDAVSLAAEYRPRPFLGLELSLGTVNLDARWRQVERRPISFNPTVLGEFVVASDSGTFSLRPVALALLVHPLRGDRVDFYVGPQVGRTDFHLGLQGPTKRDPEWTVGGKAGVELPLGHSLWSGGLVYRFIDTQHEGLEHDQYSSLNVHLLSAVLSFGGAR